MFAQAKDLAADFDKAMTALGPAPATTDPAVTWLVKAVGLIANLLIALGKAL